MFGHSFVSPFENDPFFSGHQEHMQRVNAMMGGFPDPFMSAGALTDGRDMNRHRSHRQQGALQPAFEDPFQDMFGHMNRTMASMHSMMGNMHHMMEQQRSDPNAQGHFYSQSTVMSYDGTSGGQPRVYQATSSSMTGPGGVRETRKAVRDTARGQEKMSVGRHINDRSHIIERSRNPASREIEENQEYINLDEAEADSFHHEFRERMGRGRSQRRAVNGHRHAKDESHDGRYLPSPLEGANPRRSPDHAPLSVDGKPAAKTNKKSTKKVHVKSP